MSVNFSDHCIETDGYQFKALLMNSAEKEELPALLTEINENVPAVKLVVATHASNCTRKSITTTDRRPERGYCRKAALTTIESSENRLPHRWHSQLT
ncbi:hypothetical protein [Microbulbifer magnicolonia]|uniref:hypothetical protein n=1 Tax=Microbulbifer magnicolonia TaxID=3109744 RepID=UPI002B40C8E0|nr:hypothetical protein [Microbulbifer sp. GG15]